MKDDLINSMRHYLSPHEVDLLLLQFGLMDEHTLPKGFAGPLMISEVSQLVDLKPDKVWRLINNSLRQLKALIAHNPLYDQIDDEDTEARNLKYLKWRTKRQLMQSGSNPTSFVWHPSKLSSRGILHACQ